MEKNDHWWWCTIRPGAGLRVTGCVSKFFMGGVAVLTMGMHLALVINGDAPRSDKEEQGLPFANP